MKKFQSIKTQSYKSKADIKKEKKRYNLNIKACKFVRRFSTLWKFRYIIDEEVETNNFLVASSLYSNKQIVCDKLCPKSTLNILKIKLKHSTVSLPTTKLDKIVVSCPPSKNISNKSSHYR